ncbi:GntR family transcriptional regulator [Achromobacter marplatensis]|uniref:GntR family transcriptional regulator n=1 Tax=Achromobacter marplatensis TaxID=470868 RepID=UPI0028ED6A61|nr:GntR family transcriptional regulator [Achromobacter marplatensis]
MGRHEKPRRGSTDEAYAILRKRISLGEYGPGTRLKELSLSEDLGISRTPIRAAFQRLEQDGLIISSPKRGVAVASWTDNDNDEVFDLRALMESHAASLAARRRTDQQLAEMDELNATMAALVKYRPDDFRTELQLVNRRFHQVLVEAARSPRLAKFVLSLVAIPRVDGAFFFYSDEQFESSVHDHIAITRAVYKGNSELARSLVDDHIRATSRRLQKERRQNVDVLASSETMGGLGVGDE